MYCKAQETMFSRSGCSGSVKDTCTALFKQVHETEKGKLSGSEICTGPIRETIVLYRQPLPTIETEANGDSMSAYERGPSLFGSLCWYKRQKGQLYRKMEARRASVSLEQLSYSQEGQ
jgi:hypothetical protein